MKKLVHQLYAGLLYWEDLEGREQTKQSGFGQKSERSCDQFWKKIRAIDLAARCNDIRRTRRVAAN